ncbi:tRNA (adenosine(37)-N6)-threonylcarbamoyltransferase complex ATPase subunit type 1 TsaE [Aquimarina sp. AU119]|uniref:tRNA (adenosine(37)-N6)-threonylcarbamoyltransferase complex ATPase subunit type 1 TsaE n=1 Tax=Aquimarina sp. AU119 TaxID=2108528 RepID=UPI000D6984AF|nr:tRNA (adenosine(37)-N6)-threonylcarbamoyltransferase complex ATPase subunit type 1 TsaE [Aquimarina sp. AU119]
MTLVYTLEDLPNVAKKLISNIKHKIVLFDASMGTGKTTLIKEICKQLGVQDVISSPTYSLVNEYKSNKGLIYHFDFYRIENEEEAYHIGFEEYLDSDAWVFIEWPDKIANLLPENVSKVKIDLLENQKRSLSYN